MDTIRNVTQLLIGADVAETTKTAGVLVVSGDDFNDLVLGNIYPTTVS